MPLFLRPPEDTTPLTEQLAGLGRSRKVALVAAGLFAVLAAVPALLAAAVALDAAVHVGPATRVLFLAGILAAALLLYVRRVRSPYREPADALATAHRLERQFPKLNDALASAVTFLESETPPGSPRFRQVAVVRAQNLAERFDLDAIVPAGRAWRGLLACLLVGAVVVPLALWNPARTQLGLTRLADPFGEHPWPKQTRLAILAPAKLPGLLAKGDPFDVRVRVSGVVPHAATLEVQLDGAAPLAESLPLEADAGEATLGVRLDGSRVSRDFQFRVTAHDADTGWQAVRVLPPPKLVPLDGRPSPRVRLTFPAYTRLPEQPLPDGAGVIEAVAGTRVRLSAAADRRIAAAVVRNQTEQPGLPVLHAVAPLAAANPLGAVFADAIAGQFAQDIPVSVSGSDGNRLDADFVPPAPGLYALRFTDEDGLTGVRLFDVRTFPDPPPTVLLERPAAGTDTLTVLPTAALTVRARAEDRLFAARYLALEYRVNEHPWERIAIADADAARIMAPALAGGGRYDPQPVLLQGARQLRLAALAKPDGGSPGDGDTVTLRAAGTDFDDFALGKLPGYSAEVTLRVLGPASFDALVQKELAALRPDLVRQLDAQKDAAAKLEQLAKALPADGKLSAEDRDKLAQIEQAQKQLQARLADPRDGARPKADQLRDMIRGNSLPKSPTTDRAEGVAKGLDRLDEQQLQPLIPQLGQARQAAEAPKPDPKAIKDALDKAGRQQQRAADELKAALEQLEKWAGPGELRGDVRTLKDQAKAAAAAAQKAAAPAGTSPEKLSPAEKAAAAQAAEQFEKAAAAAADLTAKAERVAAEKAASGTPEGAKEAAALKAALEKAGGDALKDDFKKAAQAARENRTGEATEAAKRAEAKLDAMRDALAEKKDAAEPDELKKKQKENAADLDKLTDDQDELQKKAKKAAADPDPATRAESMKQLAAEQEKLERRAEQLARQLEQSGQEGAAEQLRRAADQMEQNREDLNRGNAPQEKQQEDTLERLDDARDKLDQETKDDKEQLDREERAQIGKEFQALLDRQKAALAEADRLRDAALRGKKWDRPLLASLAQLEERQKALAGECRTFAEKRLGPLKVFERMLTQAAGQMDRAARALRDRREDALTADPAAFDPDAETAAAEPVRRPMAQALKRMQQIADALKPDEPKPAAGAAAGGAGGGGGGGAGGGGGGGGSGVSPLAQLKALRDWQADTNERTAAFAQAHPDPDKLTDDDKDELRDLEKAQKDIAELFDQLLPLFQGGMGNAVTHAAKVLLAALVLPGVVAAMPPVPRIVLPRVPAADGAAPPKPDDAPAPEGEDAAAVAERIAKNAKGLADKLAANDTGAETLSGQEKLKKDIDSLIKSLENPPPMGGGGGGGGSPPPPMGGGGGGGGSSQPMGGSSKPMGGSSKPMGGSSKPMGGSSKPMGGSSKPMGGSSSSGRRPRGGEKPMPGEQGTKPDGGKPEGSQPEGGKPDGDKPQGGKPNGDKPQGGKPESGKPGSGGQPGGGGMGTPALPLDEAIARDFWGNLPDLPRQRMMQFFREQYMSRYKELLPQYYQSLADKEKKGKK